MKFLNYIFQILIIGIITLFIELYCLNVYYKLNVSKSYIILKLIKKRKWIIHIMDHTMDLKNIQMKMETKEKSQRDGTLKIHSYLNQRI